MILLHTPPAYSDDVTSRHTLQIALGTGAMDFNYREFNAGKRLNREHGTLYGLSASARKTWGKQFVETDIGWFSNAVDYAGQTQNGAPVNTTTDENIVNGAALYGRRFKLAGNFQHALVAGLGYRYWQRDIRSIGRTEGVLEHYTWWYGQLGWRGIYQPTARSRWLAEIGLLRPFAAAINIEFRNDFDNTSLELGAENGVQLKLAYQFRLAEHWRLNVEGVYSAWNIGRSSEGTLRRNGAAIGKVFEPASETRSAGVTISSAYAF